MRLVYLLLVIAIVFIISIFSWLPSPQLKETGLFPSLLGKWIDEHYNSRTAVPFVFLACSMRIVLEEKSNWLANAITLGVAIFMVFLVEIGQLFLPLRHFDWADIAWGFGGAVFGVLIFECYSWLKNKIVIQRNP